MSLPPIICLMGPTAAGKTPLAVELAQHLPVDIISVDSTLVYRGMDIGTAKPDAQTLALAPHRLIDIRDAQEIYSAGEFRTDALNEIKHSHAKQRIPLLVGGTMLYFRVLQQGLADLPPADLAWRAQLNARAAIVGWESLHQELLSIDPIAAGRIHPSDTQRIQRALEVFYLTNKTISAWQEDATEPLAECKVINIGLIPTDRVQLHARIAQRFEAMLAAGFLAEAESLYRRGDLQPDLPSMRAVGYRQAWSYFAGEITQAEMTERAIIATRQLAKRQLTWLRSWSHLITLDPFASDTFAKVKALIHAYL